MINFTEFVSAGRKGDFIVADLEGERDGTHWIAEKGRWERTATPAADAEGRLLGRIKVPVGDGLSVAGLESGEQELGPHAFEHWPPQKPGEYAVREGVELTFINGFSSGGTEGGSMNFRGPLLVLRELVPPEH